MSLLILAEKSSTNDIFWTLVTNFLTEAPAREHLFQNWSLPNCEAPVLTSCSPPWSLASSCKFWEVVVEAVVPNEESGAVVFLVVVVRCFLACIPNVEEVGDECGKLAEEHWSW